MTILYNIADIIIIIIIIIIIYLIFNGPYGLIKM